MELSGHAKPSRSPGLTTSRTTRYCSSRVVWCCCMSTLCQLYVAWHFGKNAASALWDVKKWYIKLLHQSVRRRKNPKTHVKRSVLLLLLGLLDTGGLYPTDSYGYRTCLHIQNSSHLLREFRVAKTSWLFLTLRERGVTLEAFATMLWLFFWILACKCTCRLCVCACDVYYVCVSCVLVIFHSLSLVQIVYSFCFLSQGSQACTAQEGFKGSERRESRTKAEASECLCGTWTTAWMTGIYPLVN